ncbi:MAG: histidine kinase [Verrucomicrobiota bacterium]
MTNTSHMDVRALLARQQLMNQREHKRLARRIHDEISQKMTLLALQISLASSEKSPPANWATKCKDWANLVMELGQSVRSVTNELQPRILDEFGLVAALRWFAQASAGDICCTFIAPKEDISLAPFAANELFGICREIVADILVPGVARVEIELEEKEGTVRLHLRANDNGLARELITEKALDDIAAHDRLLCADGTVELNHSADGCVVTLSVPSFRPVAFSSN